MRFGAVYDRLTNFCCNRPMWALGSKRYKMQAQDTKRRQGQAIKARDGVLLFSDGEDRKPSWRWRVSLGGVFGFWSIDEVL